MRFFQRKQPTNELQKFASSPTSADIRAEFAAELARYTNIFGVERGTRFVIDGVPMAAALIAEAELLRGVLAIRDAQINEQYER